MPSRYDTPVAADAPNSAHAFALQMIGGNKRVLELGAASGHVTRELTAAGCTVTAVEVDPGAAADLEGLAHDVVVGDLNDLTILEALEAEYDVVLAGDVLEHLLRPQATLDAAVRLLRPGGKAVVSIPNVAHADVRMSLLRGEWAYRPWGLLDETHVRFFTLDAVEELARRAGLVITELRRVRIPAFETELGIERRDVVTEVLDAILADPEAETYQFVFSATRESGGTDVEALLRHNLALQAGLDLATVRAVSAEAKLAQRLPDGRLGRIGGRGRLRRIGGRVYRGLRRLLK